MRALTRTRSLAALCVLLMLTFGSIARAGAPTRPIDRSGSPPETDPVMVGDPDAGHDLLVLPFAGRLLVLRIPTFVRHLGMSIFTRTTTRTPQKQRR